MNNSLPSLFKKRGTGSELLSLLFKKSDVSDLLFLSKKTSDLLEKISIFICFWQLFTIFPHLLYALERIAPAALHSVALF